MADPVPEYDVGERDFAVLQGVATDPQVSMPQVSMRVLAGLLESEGDRIPLHDPSGRKWRNRNTRSTSAYWSSIVGLWKQMIVRFPFPVHASNDPVTARARGNRQGEAVESAGSLPVLPGETER